MVKQSIITLKSIMIIIYSDYNQLLQSIMTLESIMTNYSRNNQNSQFAQNLLFLMKIIVIIEKLNDNC